MKELRNKVAQLKGLYENSEKRCQRLQTALRSRPSKEKENARLEKRIKELQEQLKSKDGDLKQRAVQLEKTDKKLVDAQSAKRDLEDANGQLKSRLRSPQAELEKADGVLLHRTEKLLGITAVPERSDEEIRKLRDGLQQQVKKKARPHHWSKSLDLWGKKQYELQKVRAILECKGVAMLAQQFSDKVEAEAQDLSQEVAQAKKLTEELVVEVRRLERDHDLLQYKDALDASEDVLRMLGEDEFASKLFNPGVPAKEDRRDIPSDSHLFRFVKGLMLRSLTHSRLCYHSDEWCQLAQYDIISIKKCINPELSTRYKFEQMKLAQKHPDGVKLPHSLHALELDSKVGELALFHGCREEVVPQILKQGFDFRIAGGNAGTMFGGGAYFAEQLGRDMQ